MTLPASQRLVTEAKASATYAARTVVPATPASGSSRTEVEVNGAITTAAALGTQADVLVPRLAGPWTANRSDPAVQSSGAFVVQPGVGISSDNALVNLAANTSFIRATSALGASQTITADLATTSTSVTVGSSAGFASGDTVFLRLGQAAYDAAEPDYWLFAKVASVPDSTHISLDRPVGYALTVASVASATQKSIQKVTTLNDDVAIDGTWRLVNSATGAANAEAGVSLQWVPRARIGSIVATNPGAGAVLAQFVDSLAIESIKVPACVAQGGQASKGRILNLAEVRNARIGTVEGANFDGAAIVAEGRCEAVSIETVRLENTSSTRDNSGTPLVSLLGNSKMRIGSMHLTGKGSYLYDTGGTAGNHLSIRSLFCYTSSRPTISDLSIVEDEFYVDGTLYTRRETYTKIIPLTPNMAPTNFALPSGYLRRTRVYVNDKTGISNIYLGSTASLSGEFKANLVNGQSVPIAQGAGFGSAYAPSADTGKRIVVQTDATVPAGAFLVVKVDYFADPATEADLSNAADVGPHGASHRLGGTDDLFVMAGQDNPKQFSNIPWYTALNTNNNTNGTVHWVYVTAPTVQALVAMTINAGATASAGATLARMGLYTEASNGDLTLVARTANDTTILQSTSNGSSKLFDATGGYPTTVNSVPGKRYALAFIVVGATTAGTYRGVQVNGSMSNFGGTRRAGLLAGQADLPTTIAVGSMSSDPNPPFLVVHAA